MALLSSGLTRVAATLVAAGLVLGPALGAQAPEPGERTVKAAFLYNFTKFVDWPAAAFGGAVTPFRVCVFADPTFRREIDAMLAGETVNGRPLQVVTPDAADTRNCHIAYFGPGETQRAGQILPALREAPVLTVGEGSRFLEQGGLISFLLDENRVRFDVNKPAVDRARLTVSSKLLRVARTVQTRDGRQPPQP